MSTELKGFITRDDFITPRNQDVSPIYELSDVANTYARTKQVIYPINKPIHALHVFNLKNATEVTDYQATTIITVVEEFNKYLASNPNATKLQIIVGFLSYFNNAFAATPVVDLSYNSVISHNLIKAPDYVTFKVLDVVCSIWLSDELFRTFYPDYEISVSLPFDNFASIIKNTSEAIDAITGFDPVEFNSKLEIDKEGHPPTHTRLLNITYKVPNTTLEKNCYFGFNIYGKQGNYDHILKLELYRILTQELSLEGVFIEDIFPTILKINEFFVVPRWDKLAIQTQVGQIGIGSQVSMTYEEAFDMDKYIKIYNNNTFLKSNTYNVPFPYNNMLLNVVNGYYSEEEVKLFHSYYPDMISVGSSHPDFARMSTRTQRFMTMLETMLSIANANNQTELFNKVVQNREYNITIIARGSVSYISVFYDKHQYYMLPKYQMFTLG